MKNTLLLIGLFLLLISASAQNNVGINITPDPSAVLDVSATDKGLLIPRMTEAEMNAITAPATSLMVFNTTANAFWYWDGSQWTEFRSGTSLWTLSGTAIDVSDTTYKVGIGTSNPSGKFEVATINHTGSYGSDVAAGGTANASEEYPGQPASLAFDDSPTTYWSNNNTLPVWIGYDLGAGNEKRVARYHIAYNSVVTSDNSPNDWTFEGSNDGASWTVLDTQTGQGWTATGIKTYDFSNTTQYRYYRLNITDNKGTTNDFVSVYEMEMKEEMLTSQSTFSVSENGVIRIADGNEADGKILVSDVSGNVNWADGATVNGGGWTVNGNYIFNTNDSVGIGTATPGAELEVVGHISQTGTGGSVFLGEEAGASDDSTDNQNVFVGHQSGKANTYGYYNTALGYRSLFSNTSGLSNTAGGYESLLNNTTGHSNTANGNNSLYSNTTGIHNTANGFNSLYSNTTGIRNTANGVISLYSNTTGEENTANGYKSMYFNTTGVNNTASGTYSLYYNTTGYQNAAVGNLSLHDNTTGYQNAAVGNLSLHDNTTGHQNTALGYSAFSSGAAHSNSTGIGYDAEPGASNTIRLGNSSVTTIGGYANWTNVSDGRFKTNVQENVSGLDFILKLRPVTYNLNMDAIAAYTRTPDSLRLSESERLKEAEVQIGFIAQEVEAAADALGFDFHGVDKPKNKMSHYGLRYAEFVVPLVKAVQELSEQNQQQEATIEKLKEKLSEIDKLKLEIEQMKQMMMNQE